MLGPAPAPASAMPSAARAEDEHDDDEWAEALLPVLEHWCQLGGADQASIEDMPPPRTADALRRDVRAEEARLARLRARRNSPHTHGTNRSAYDARVVEAQRRHEQRPLHAGAIVDVYIDHGTGAGPARGIVAKYIDGAKVYAVETPYKDAKGFHKRVRYVSPLHLYPWGAPVPPKKQQRHVIAHTVQAPKKSTKSKKANPLRDPPPILDDAENFALTFHVREVGLCCDRHEFGELAGQLLAYALGRAPGVGLPAHDIFVADVEEAPSWTEFALSIIEDVHKRKHQYVHVCYDICAAVTVDPTTGSPLLRNRVKAVEDYHSDYLPQYQVTQTFSKSLEVPQDKAKWKLMKACIHDDKPVAFDILRRQAFTHAVHASIHRNMCFDTEWVPVHTFDELMSRVYNRLCLDPDERMFVNRTFFPYNALWCFIPPLCEVCLEALRKERRVVVARKWCTVPHDAQIANLRTLHEDFSCPRLTASFLA